MKMIYGDLLSQDYYVASFMSGLTTELKASLKMMKPTTLQAAIELGRDQMETIEAITRRVKFSAKPYQTPNVHVPNRAPVQNYTPPTKASTTSRPQVKLLTAPEMAVRRENGLCFNCDERFSPGHKCRQRVYLIMTDEEELNYAQVEGDESGMEMMKMSMKQQHIYH